MAVPKRCSLSESYDSGSNGKEQRGDNAHDSSERRSLDDETEEELDRRLEHEATELGICIEKFKASPPVQEVGNTAACVAPCALVEQSVSSRFSQSTFPTSRSSSEQQPITNASSFSSCSIPSGNPSLLSFSAKKSSYHKIKRGFRRISGFQRRKMIGYPIPITPSLIPRAHAAVQSEPDVLARVVSIKKLSISEGRVSLKEAALVPTQYSAEEPTHDPAATRRSLESEQLKNLRSEQLKDRSQILEVQQEQRGELCAKLESQRVQVMSSFQQQEHNMKERHRQAVLIMEDRHLSAEADLHRTLELQRQACETRLRHMEAYCNSPTAIEGMPTRTVTDKDFRGLAQQYHVRDSMESLHDSRINVLREKQAKQLECVFARQGEELANLTEQRHSELAEIESTFNQRVAEDNLAFDDKRRKFARRWSLAEAISRRRLEIETGEKHAPLVPISWGAV
ncbi:hypothetical protein MMC16_001117 [Acarospora aff. strigata]|nr:hypothetical protein [Acarospora aff. strigata]